MAKKELFCKPLFNHILKPQHLLSTDSVILTVDMLSVVVPELEQIDSKFSFKVTQPGIFHGFGSWFSVEFGQVSPDKEPVVLATGPENV